MNLLAALARRPLLWILIAVAGALALVLFALLAYRPPLQAQEGPTPAPADYPDLTVAPGSAAPSEQQAAQVATAFGQAYFSGGDVLPYLTPAQARAWARQASAQLSTPATVSAVTATPEGAASDGSQGFVVDARIGVSEQAVEVFEVEQGGHWLIERVSP